MSWGRLLELLLAWFALLLALGCALVKGPTPARGAPFLIRPTHARPVTQASLWGTWDVDWAGVRCWVSLRPRGVYQCLSRGRLYYGTWSVREGVLWIDEVAGIDPYDGAIRRQLYRVRLDWRAKRGVLIEGGTGEVRFLRRGAVKAW